MKNNIFKLTPSHIIIVYIIYSNYNYKDIGEQLEFDYD